MKTHHKQLSSVFILLCFCSVGIINTTIALPLFDASTLPMDTTSIKNLPYFSGDETPSTSSEVDMDGYYIMAGEQNDLDFSHFFLHIPKAAGVTVFKMITKLVGGGIFKDTNPWTYRPCNEGTHGSLSEFRKRDSSGTPCNLWMTERAYGHFKMKQRHTYTIVRSPMEHVVSQYFHCKESKDHQHLANKMPSLDDWLDHHVQRMEEKNITKAEFRSGGKFKCYDAINHQSMMTGFNEKMSESQLRNKFDVIGVMDHLTKSACAVSIRYTGAVHPSCDCTDITKRRRNLRAGDHGVKHHGATFKLTDSQTSKIQKLTQLDSLLYDRAKVAFATQVKEIEEELDIVLCQNPDLK